MRTRLVPYIPIIGIALSALVLIAFYAPRDRNRRQRPRTPPTQGAVRRPTPQEVRLQSEYEGLPQAKRIALFKGVPYDDLPANFRTAIRGVLLQQNQARREHARSELAAGNISRLKFEEDREYDAYVVSHLADYSYSANGDNYAIVLFRSLLPGRDRPEQDVGRGVRGICRIK